MVSSWCKFVLEKEEKLKDNKIYNTALYCRLSLDDGSVGELGSIQTQKIILEEYAKMYGFKIYDVYVDDITVSDKLKQALIVEDSESYTVFDDSTRDEFLFHIWC